MQKFIEQKWAEEIGLDFKSMKERLYHESPAWKALIDACSETSDGETK